MLMVFTVNLAPALALLFIKKQMLIVFTMDLAHLLVLFSIKSRASFDNMCFVQDYHLFLKEKFTRFSGSIWEF